MTLKNLALAFSLLAAASTAHADSFMTSVGNGSRRAAKIGPAPYTGASTTMQQAKTMLPRAIKLALGKNLAVAMDATRMVDSAAMDNPAIGAKFATSLAKAAKHGTAAHRFIDAYNTLNRDPGNKAAVRQLRNAMKSKYMQQDSAAELGEFEALAQKASFGGGSAAQTAKLYREAARHLQKADKLEATTSHRLLVRAGLASAKDYAAYYPELKADLGK